MFSSPDGSRRSKVQLLCLSKLAQFNFGEKSHLLLKCEISQNLNPTNSAFLKPVPAWWITAHLYFVSNPCASAFVCMLYSNEYEQPSQHHLHVTLLLPYSARCVLTQADSLLHPGQKVFGIAAPQLGVLQRSLHSILTAKEGQVCILGCEGVHQHHCTLCELGATSRADIESTGLHPTAPLSCRTHCAPKLKEKPVSLVPTPSIHTKSN